MTLTDTLIRELSNLPRWRQSLRRKLGTSPTQPVVVYCGRWVAGLSTLATYASTCALLESLCKSAAALGADVRHVVLDHSAAQDPAGTQVFAVAAAHGLPARELDYRSIATPSFADPKPAVDNDILACLLGADLVLTTEFADDPASHATARDDRYIVFAPAHLADWGVRRCTAAEAAEAVRLTFLSDTSLYGLRTARNAGAPQGGDEAADQFSRLARDLLFRLTDPVAIGSDPATTATTAAPVWKTFLGVESMQATGYHGGERKELVDLSPRPIRCALDIGCAAGGTGAYIKQKYRGARVVGIEMNRAAARIAETRLDAVLTGKFEEIDLADAGLRPGDIDTVIVADVLEHMYDPWSVLTSLLPWLSPDAQVIASIPNIRNLKHMEAMSAGFWRYEPAGLLDITHIRFFTLREVRRFFHETGYHVRTLRYALDSRLLKLHQENAAQTTPIDITLGRMTLRGVDTRELDELCSLQFHVVAGINARIDDIEHYETVAPEIRLQQHLALTTAEHELWRRHLAGQASLPQVELFLIDLPGDIRRVSETVAELLEQHYPRCRIVVVSPNAMPAGLRLDERIDWIRHAPDTPPFAAINERLATTQSAWTGVIYGGDSVDRSALLRMLEIARSAPEACCLYGDDSIKMREGTGAPHLKTDFDFALLLGTDYLGNGLTLLRTEWLREASGFAAQLPGAEIFDAALRLYQQKGGGAFSHLPEPVLARPTSGNNGDIPFSRVIQSRKSAIAAFFQAAGIDAAIEDGWLPGTLRIRHALREPPKISLLLVLDSTSADIHKHLDALLENTDYADYELLILDNGVTDASARKFLEGIDALASGALRVFRTDAALPRTAAINLLAGQSSGQILAFLEDCLIPTGAKWLGELASLLALHQAGAVAPRVLTSAGTLRSSGLIVGIDRGCEDAFAGRRHDDLGTFGRAHLVQRFSALPDACTLVLREAFEAAGGLDEALGDAAMAAMADLTMRLTEAGLVCLWTPFVSLLYPQPAAADRSDAHRLPETLLERHLPLLSRDPAYHPALSLAKPVFSYEQRKELLGERLPWRPLPKILAFNADLGGCGYYRIIDPANTLSESLLAEANATPMLFDAVEIGRVKPDALIAQRQITDAQLERLERIHRINRTPIIYELDDLISEIPPNSPHAGEMPTDIRGRLQRGIALSERLVVSTEPLARALRALHDDIRVVPNRLLRKRWENLGATRRPGTKPRVGWSGSISHVDDLKLIERVVRELADEVDWIFMGLAPSALKPHIAEYHPGVPFDKYPQALANLNLDLALAPLEPNRFNESKSPLKLLEYGILGFPVIATDFVPYQCELPVTRVANAAPQWIRAIREQLAERDALARAGQELRAAVLKHWMLDDHLQDWLSAWTL